MSINRPCLFKCVEQKLFSLKKKFFVLHIFVLHSSYYKPIFHRNIFLFRLRENRLLSQKCGLFFLQVNICFFGLIALTDRKNNFTYLFLITSKKSYVHIKPNLISGAHFHTYMSGILCQSNSPEHTFQWDTIINTHPLAKEVIDYLGAAFSAF